MPSQQMVTTMNELLMRHRTALGRALRNFHYEKMPNGSVLFPREGLFIGGLLTTWVNGSDEQSVSANIVTDQGIANVLGSFLPVTGRVSVPTNLYFIPYINDVEPADTLTAANFHSIMAEFTNYTESTRQVWTGGAVSGGAANNNASPATLTAGTGGGTIRGAGLGTASAKSATTGFLLNCAPFAFDRVLAAGDQLGMKFDIGAQDAG
jgi:hypothetical protein